MNSVPYYDPFLVSGLYASDADNGLLNARDEVVLTINDTYEPNAPSSLIVIQDNQRSLMHRDGCIILTLIGNVASVWVYLIGAMLMAVFHPEVVDVTNGVVSAATCLSVLIPPVLLMLALQAGARIKAKERIILLGMILVAAAVIFMVGYTTIDEDIVKDCGTSSSACFVYFLFIAGCVLTFVFSCISGLTIFLLG